jgi:hypothetical protein
MYIWYSFDRHCPARNYTMKEQEVSISARNTCISQRFLAMCRAFWLGPFLTYFLQSIYMLLQHFTRAKILSELLCSVFQRGIKPALSLRSIDGKLSTSSLLNIFLSLCMRSTTNLFEKSSGIK